MAIPLLALPSEVVERILISCHHPRDVAHFAQTCHAARKLVYEPSDQFLWRELFLAHPFDDPRKAVPPFHPQDGEYDWASSLQRRVEAEAIITSGVAVPDAILVRALDALLATIDTASPAPALAGPPKSVNLVWLDDIFHRVGSLATPASASDGTAQRWARLRACLALAYSEYARADARSASDLLRRTSRCFVYDLRRYTPETLWGPFRRREDGKLVADWVHVEHVVNVVTLKLREHSLHRFFGKPLDGVHATRAYSAPGSMKRRPRDWAGVTGTWRRFVCFMDYRDLFAFNFSLFQEGPPQGPLDPSFFDHGYQEAIRPIEVILEIVEDDNGDDRDTEEEYPDIYFKGSSRGPHSIDAVVEGSVSKLADSSIRWRFITKYDGLTQWSAESIQLGNVCSAAGLAGIWTGAFHEEADPAGPFLMWKLSGNFPQRS